ncbi:MAG: hypothetical protein MW690_000327 [Methanophagales archaeon]|nr:hypothetical protein [Methanophagales archaeon]MCU4139765.1 hypothetical protein [Methanophagales archaeon]
MDRKLSGVRADIIGYQLAERIKSGLIIGFKVISAAEGLEGDELKGAKRAILAYLDALSAETGIALNATRLVEFSQVSEKIAEIRKSVEEGLFNVASAKLGEALSRATTACDKKMRALSECGLI